VCAIAGGLAGLFFLAAFDPRDDMDAIAMVVGAVAAVALNRLLRS
jgi:hypothetical protein